MAKVESSSLFEITIPIFYIINQYSIENIPLGLVLLLFALLTRFIKGGYFGIFPPFTVLFGFMILVDIARAFFVPINIGSMAEKIIYFCFLSAIIGQINEKKLYKVWKIVGTLAAIGVCIQAFQVYILQEPVQMIKILPFFKTANLNFTVEYMRPHSIFLEPAAYVTWILPLLCMSMEQGEIKFSAFISFTVLLSTSSVGIIMVGIAWLYYIIFNRDKRFSKSYHFLLAVLTIVGLIIFIEGDIFIYSFNKLVNLSLENTSNYVRIFFGYDLFWSMPLVYKICGIPFNSVQDYLLSGEVRLGEFNLNNTIPYLGFVNSISNCMIIYGEVGLVLYLRLFYKVFTTIDEKYYCLLLLIFISNFGQSVFWNGFFVTQFSVLLGCAVKNGYKKIVWR